ncbi:hypothetical protein LguiA_028275 [Lonicera macranthoides]
MVKELGYKNMSKIYYSIELYVEHIEDDQLETVGGDGISNSENVGGEETVDVEENEENEENSNLENEESDDESDVNSMEYVITEDNAPGTKDNEPIIEDNELNDGAGPSKPNHIATMDGNETEYDSSNYDSPLTSENEDNVKGKEINKLSSV